VAPARPTTADDPRLDRFADEVLPGLADRFRDVRLTLAAGDPLAHPGVVPMLGGLDRGLRMRVRLDTPGTLLADGAVARSLAAVRVPVEVRVALLGATAATHDAVAGRPGGHGLVTAGLAALAAAGVPCSVSSVPVSRNLHELPALAAATVAAGRKLHLAYPRPSGAPGRRTAPGVRAPIDDVRAAVAAALPSLEECLAGATGLPACALPPTLRPLRLDGPGSGRADAGLAACGRCASLQSCVGVDAEYVQEFGERGLEPFT
jgi:MoaA/NifB/PqqE/SkfB family radical SAM enzyme